MMWGQFRECYAGAGFSKRHRAMLTGLPTDIESGRAMFNRIPRDTVLGCMEALRTDGGSVTLFGPRGTGKTQFAAWLTLAHAWWLSQREEAKVTELPCFHYDSWPDVLHQEKAGFDQARPSTALWDCAQMDLLILDEVFEALNTDWERSSFTRLIDQRYGDMRRTIVIGNTIEEILPKQLGTSAFSRLTETGVAVHCDWEAYR